MSRHTVRADWLGEQHAFLLRDRQGFPVATGEPLGANAADLLPMSLIGCSAYDAIGIALKQRQRVTALAVAAECEQDDDPPWRYQRIRLVYHFRGYDLSERALRRAVELAEGKYCAVYATLRDAVAIESVVEIENL